MVGACPRQKGAHETDAEASGTIRPNHRCRSDRPPPPRLAAKRHHPVHPLELDRIVAQRRDWHRGGDEQDRYPTLDDHRRGGLGERLFFGGFQPQSLAQCLGLSFPLGCKAYFSARLRSAGARIDARDRDGRSAEDVAAELGREGVVELLRDARRAKGEL